LNAPEVARIVVLISGRGSNMRALAARSADPAMGYQVAGVLSDRPQAAGLEAAADLGIPARALIPGPAAPRAEYEAALAAAIEEFAPSLIVLAGFMRILSAPFVARYAGRILNIHPSLLPKYPGLDTHRRVLAARESEHGATVHFVTEQLDGGPLIIQGRIRVEPDDDARSLQARVHVLEHRIYPLAVRWYCSGRLRYGEGGAWLDGKPLSVPVQYDGTEVH
jgi:phosphoribosylglycinamide formyltransferase-1